MKLKIDENLPSGCADVLRGAGLDADTVADERLTGAEDFRIAERCRSEGRVLITLDLDFANIRAYPPAEYAGIIILRAKKQDKHAVLTLVDRIALVLTNRVPGDSRWLRSTRARATPVDCGSKRVVFPLRNLVRPSAIALPGAGTRRRARR